MLANIRVGYDKQIILPHEFLVPNVKKFYNTAPSTTAKFIARFNKGLNGPILRVES